MSFRRVERRRADLELGPPDQEDDVFSAFGGFSLTKQQSKGLTALMTPVIKVALGVAQRLVNEAGSL